MEILKNWIIKTFFQSHLDKATRKGSMDAFKKAHEDIMETMSDDLEKKAEELAQIKLSNLLSPTNLSKIITIDKQRGLLYIGGELADDKTISNLKAEAEFFNQSELWKLIIETPKELAQKSMFINGEDLASMQKGRSILYTLSVQKNIIDTFMSYVKK